MRFSLVHYQKTFQIFMILFISSNMGCLDKSSKDHHELENLRLQFEEAGWQHSELKSNIDLLQKGSAKLGILGSSSYFKTDNFTGKYGYHFEWTFDENSSFDSDSCQLAYYFVDRHEVEGVTKFREHSYFFPANFRDTYHTAFIPIEDLAIQDPESFEIVASTLAYTCVGQTKQLLLELSSRKVVQVQENPLVSPLSLNYFPLEAYDDHFSGAVYGNFSLQVEADAVCQFFAVSFAQHYADEPAPRPMGIYYFDKIKADENGNLTVTISDKKPWRIEYQKIDIDNLRSFSLGASCEFQDKLIIKKYEISENIWLWALN